MHLADSLKACKYKFDQLRVACDFQSNALSGIIVNLYFLGKIRTNNDTVGPMILLVSSRIYQTYLCMARLAGVIPAVEIVVVKNLGAVRKCLDALEREMWTGILIICGQLYTEHRSEILSTKIGRNAIVI